LSICKEHLKIQALTPENCAVYSNPG